MTRRAALCLASFAALLAGPRDTPRRGARRPRPEERRRSHGGREAAARRGRGGSRQPHRRRGLDRRGAGLRGKPDARPRPRGPHGRPRLRRLARPPAGDRLRAPRRGPRGDEKLRRGGRACGDGREGPPAGRVDPRSRLARGQVGRAGGRVRARVPHPRGALRRVSRQPGRPRPGRRPRRPRQREGHGRRRHLARRRSPPRGARSSATRRARRPVSSWTTPRGSSPPRSARPTRSVAPSSWRWTSASRRASPA